jgi:putative membrane protein (TIGR04086 family)
MFVDRNDIYRPLNIQAVVRGTILSFIFAVILILTAAAITYNFNQLASMTMGISLAIYLIACFVAGAFASRIAGNKGLWHGLLAGFLVFLCSLMISIVIVPGHLVFAYIFKKLLVSLIAGVIGGILGVGIR